MRTYNQIMTGLQDLGHEYPIEDALDEWSTEDCYDHPEETRYLLWSYEEYLARRLMHEHPVRLNVVYKTGT